MPMLKPLGSIEDVPALSPAMMLQYRKHMSVLTLIECVRFLIVWLARCLFRGRVI